MKNVKDIENEQLVVLIKEGNQNALSELIARFTPSIKRLSRSYFLFGGEEDDLRQEALIGLYSACISYKIDMSTKFSTFAELCMKRKILSAIKSANSEKNKILNHSMSISSNFDDDNDVLLYLPQYVFNPDKQIEENENYEEIKEKIIRLLSKLETKILNMFLKGLSYREISSKLDITKKSVDNALSRIKSKLKHLVD